MPPGRRGRPPGSKSTPANPQQRLSFGPNASNKITKPSTLSQPHSKKLSPTQRSVLSAAIKDEIEDAAPESPSAEQEEKVKQEAVLKQQEEEKSLPIRRNAREKVEKQTQEKRDVKEVEAMKISEAQINRYWKAKEEARIAPRVHQKGLGVHEKVLREFDLSSQFGVCSASLPCFSIADVV